ncbi:hypothetical protein ACKWTF_012163 [Chironomus riparius]
MKMILIKEDLWDVIVPGSSNPEDAVKSLKALAHIVLMVDNDQLVHVSEAKGGKEPERHKGSICLPYGSYTEPPCSTLHLKIFRKPYYHGTLTEPKLRKSSVGRAFINTKWKSYGGFDGGWRIHLW